MRRANPVEPSEPTEPVDPSSLFCLMHDKLREGDIDPRCIEGLLHADVKVILRIEVFRTFYGSADIDADGGVSHTAHIDGELFLIDHIRIPVNIFLSSSTQDFRSVS